jgi:hypothetical protein
LAHWTRNQRIGVAAIIVSVFVGVLVPFYLQGPRYDYSFSNDGGRVLSMLTPDNYGKLNVGVYVKNSGQSGIVTFTVTGLNVTFTDKEGKGSYPSASCGKTSSKDAGWEGCTVFVKPDPIASTFTLFLSASGQFPSEAHPSDPTTLSYKKTAPSTYVLQE